MRVRLQPDKVHGRQRCLHQLPGSRQPQAARCCSRTPCRSGSSGWCRRRGRRRPPEGMPCAALRPLCTRAQTPPPAGARARLAGSAVCSPTWPPPPAGQSVASAPAQRATCATCGRRRRCEQCEGCQGPAWDDVHRACVPWQWQFATGSSARSSKFPPPFHTTAQTQSHTHKPPAATSFFSGVARART